MRSLTAFRGSTRPVSWCIAGSLLALLWLSGCDRVPKPQDLTGTPAPAPAPPPAAPPIDSPPRTGEQIVAEFKELSPPLRTDERLIELSQQAGQVPAITQLDLSGSAVTDIGAETLPRFAAVTDLSLSNSRVSGDAIPHVAQLPELEVFHLDSIRIDDFDLSPLAEKTGLRELSLNGTGVGDASFEHLARLEQLQSLSLSGNDRLMGRTFSELIKEGRFAALTTLVADQTLFGFGGLKELSSLKELERLSLNSCDVTDEALLGIRGCTSLRFLSLGSNKITDEGLKSLSALKQLEELHLHGNPAITDDGLPRLRGLAQLQVLSLDGTRCTLEAARRLKEQSLEQTTIRIAGEEL